MKSCQNTELKTLNWSQSTRSQLTVKNNLSKKLLEERRNELNQLFFLTEEELTCLDELVETISKLL